MHRTTNNVSPRLEALLDERDHLRIQINLAEHGQEVDPAILAAAHHRLAVIDQQIKERGDAEPSAPA
jgi:hypothetical protein